MPSATAIKASPSPTANNTELHLSSLPKGALLSYLEETQVDSVRIFDLKWIEKTVFVEKSGDHLFEGRSDAGVGCDPPADHEFLKPTGNVQTDR